MICSVCKNHLYPHGKMGSVWYYSVNCQKGDWKERKTQCKFRMDRLVLFRIGDTLQKIFHIYREVLFDKVIARIEEKQGDFSYTRESMSKKKMLLTASDLSHGI